MFNISVIRISALPKLATVMLLVSSLLLSGCVTKFGEQHFYQLKSDQTGIVTNYYRLNITGYASMSSARYVSGFYDERAVDLFFNEMKLGKTAPNTTSGSELFVDQQTNPGTTGKITPLSPSAGDGSLVMILSSNASSVTNTIGQFAESQVVAEAVSNLANRDLLAVDTRRNQAAVLSANAAASELDQLMKLLPTPANAKQVDTEKALLRVLNAIVRGVTPQQETLSSFNTAEDWLKRVKQGGL